MVRHNNVIPDEHYRKKWDRRVKTWFQQPIQKKIRRERRRLKAASIAPRPISGSLRPLVHCPTQKYNSKLKLGRGFTLEELKEAKITPSYAKTVGIAVDHRRTNKSVESLQLNASRLQEYISRLLVFPRGSKVKNGESSFDEVNSARQLKGAIVARPTAEPAVTKISISEEMSTFKAYSTLRAARNDAKLVGIRKKKASEKKEEAPTKSDD